MLTQKKEHSLSYYGYINSLLLFINYMPLLLTLLEVRNIIFYSLVYHLRYASLNVEQH